MEAVIRENYIPEELVMLSGVEGISISDGLRYCGGVREFDRFLESFYQDIDFKSSELESAYYRGDIGYLIIKTHALKTSAQVIGATKLHDLAYHIELAGKAGDILEIDDTINELLELYRSYKDILEDYIGAKKSKRLNRKPISDYELEEAYDALREVVPAMDDDAVELILEELCLYKLSDYHQNVINEITRLLKQYDWEGIERLLYIETAV